jgi:hypothetical protein
LSDNIEEAFLKIEKDLTFDDVQSVYRNWMSHLAWVIENSGEYVHESNGIHLLLFTEHRNRRPEKLPTITEITIARRRPDDRPDINRNESIAQSWCRTKLEIRVTMSNGKKRKIFNHVGCRRCNDSMTEVLSASIVN